VIIYIYDYTYTYISMKRKRIVDITRGRILFLEDKQPDFCSLIKEKNEGRRENWCNLCKYCTCLYIYIYIYSKRRISQMMKFCISLVIIKVHTCKTNFFFSFSQFFSSLECQLRFSLASLLLLTVELHHKYYMYALSPKSI
jgi:hypothetical protein